MKKVVLFASIAVFFAAALSGCSKYDAERCETPVLCASDSLLTYYQPDEEPFDFSRRVTEGGIEFYFEKGLAGKKLDHAIDSVKLVKEFFEIPPRVFLAEGTPTRVLKEGLFAEPSDPPELIGAALLEAQNKDTLPFGIFAGVSAAVLGEKASFSRLHEAETAEFPSSKEMQYPLYLPRYTPERERFAAWTFAETVGKEWLKSHTAADLATASEEEILSVCEKSGAQLPACHFPVGSGAYPLQARSENVNFFFAYNFSDLMTGEGAPGYSSLKEIVQESENLLQKVGEIYKIENLEEPVDVFFGKKDEFGLLTNVVSRSDFSRNAIAIYTFSALGRELARQITYQDGADGYPLGYALADYYAMEFSRFHIGSAYLSYKLDFEARSKSQKISKEDEQIYRNAAKLYDESFGKADEKTFDARKFTKCLSYVVSEEKGRPQFLCSFVTFTEFIYKTYGHGTMMEINYANVEKEELDRYYQEWWQWLNAELEA